jgi:hypothetical protein
MSNISQNDFFLKMMFSNQQQNVENFSKIGGKRCGKLGKRCGKLGNLWKTHFFGKILQK